MSRVKEVGNKGKLHVELDSVTDAFRVIRKMGWTPQREMASNRKGNDGNFYVFKSLAEALDVFENHPERIRDFSANDDKLTNVESPGKDVEYDVTGDFLDIDRYLEGIPEVFGNAVMGNPKSVFCTINILNSMVSYTDKNYQMQKQKRVLRLVDWLESQGIRCQIMMTDDSEINFTTTVVKEFGDPFDLNHLAVGMHTDYFRRVGFLIKEQSKTWSYGYGSARDYDLRMQKYVPQPEDGLYVYVGGYMPYSSVAQLDEAFDRIEEGIQKVIDDGMSFSEKALMVTGHDGW